MDYSDQPISNIRWLHRDMLSANHYNPNRVMAPELKLLKQSIIEDGWTQPIVTLPEEDGVYVIVDGFHRWTVSDSSELRALTGGYVPTVQVKLDPTHRMMSTIRHNRARGVHGVVAMAQIVRQMLADGLSEKEIMLRVGMEREEIARLNNRAGMPAQIGAVSPDFNQAWVPGRPDEG